VTSSPAQPSSSTAPAAGDPSSGADGNAIAAAVQAHRNQKFDPQGVQAGFQQLMREYALFCTGGDFSISDQDIADLGMARDGVLAHLNDRFHKLIVMSQERQRNLLRFSAINVISLGLDCLSRTVCCRWGLKKTRRLGEPSGPFDLSVHPPLSIEQLITQDFPSYLDAAHLKFSENHNFCINTLHHIHFNHETGRDFADAEFSRLRSVYSARINNLKAGLRDPRPLCLVVYIPFFTNLDSTVVASLRRLLEHIHGLRHGAPATMAIINAFSPGGDAGVDEICDRDIRLWNVPLPSADYVWFEPNCFLSDEGFAWERGIAERFKERIAMLLP